MGSRFVRVTSFVFAAAVVGSLVAACGSDSSSDAPDGGSSSGGQKDAGHDAADAGKTKDSSVPTGDDDSGEPPIDSGSGGEASSGAGKDAGTGTACANPPCINVINGCPFPLWIHGAGQGGDLQPDNARIEAVGQSGNIRQFDVPASWPAARVNAYWEDPNGGGDPAAFDKVELTVANGSMNYNITYVDYLALPVRMEAVGPQCAKMGGFDPRVECALPVSDVLTGCPSTLLDGKRCLSAGSFCAAGPNHADPFCHQLDDAVTQCEQQNPDTCGVAAQLADGTPSAFGCAGYFDSQPPGCSPATATCHKDGNKWCAALNRGMLANPDSLDTSQYYKNGPFNPYAKWVHDTCPGIYAFPYDDYPSGAGESGFRSCTADRLDITFCPGG